MCAFIEVEWRKIAKPFLMINRIIKEEIFKQQTISQLSLKTAKPAKKHNNSIKKMEVIKILKSGKNISIRNGTFLHGIRACLMCSIGLKCSYALNLVEMGRR